MKLEFNVNKIFIDKKDDVIEAVNKSLVELKKSIDAKTPEDTFKLIKNNKVRQAKVVWKTVVWSIYNNTEYALIVEEWVRGRKYNYYKDWWRRKWWTPFWIDEWARMFERWLEDTKDYILNKLKYG